MSDEALRLLGYLDTEAPGRDRAEAIANALAFMDKHSVHRRKPAGERLRARRAQMIYRGWWRIRFVAIKRGA